MYAIALGHDVSLGSLTPITDIVTAPPKSEGVQYPERLYSIARTSVVDGEAFVRWEWSFLRYDDMNNLLDELGLTADTPDVEVTIYTVTDFNDSTGHTYARYNATAHWPMPGEDRKKAMGQWDDVVLLITGLEEPA